MQNANKMNYFSIHDMENQFFFGGVSIVMNILIFLIFYLSPTRKNTTLANLIMMMCLSECIILYCSMIVVLDFPEIVKILNVRSTYEAVTYRDTNKVDLFYTHYSKFFTPLNEDDQYSGNMSLNMMFIFKINCSLYSAFLTLSLFLEICYCLEVICIFKYPISDFSKRSTLYFILAIVTSIISFVLSYFIFIDEALDYTSDFLAYYQNISGFYASQSFNVLLFLGFIIIGVFSIIYVINIIFGKSKFYSSERLIFIIRHVIYISTHIGLWAFPLFIFLSSSVSELPNVYFVMNLSGLILGVIRIFELGNPFGICNCFKKNDEAADCNENVSSDIMSSVQSGSLIKNEECPNTSAKSMNIEGLHKSLISEISQGNETRSKTAVIEKQVINEKAESTVLLNTILMEYMFYIIQGILKIGELASAQSSPYLINKKSYSEIAYHKFQQVNINSKKDLETISDIKIQSIVSEEKALWKRCFSVVNICNGKIQLLEYAPKVFRNILKLDNLNYDDIYGSFNIRDNIANISNLSMSEGKSGSFFFFTYDNRFIIKTISQRELTTLLKEFIVPYYEFVTENNFTLLARTYGVFTLSVGLSRITVILMENVAPIESNKILRKFDLKGSLVGRETKNLKLSQTLKTLKDKDFLELKRLDKNLTIEFEEKSVNQVVEILKYDLSLLRNCYLMDYSFFLTICKNDAEFDTSKCFLENRLFASKDKKYLYFIAIIDYLTKFDSYKQIENKYKSIMEYSNRKAISAINPVDYGDRFIKFITQRVFNLK